LQSSIGLFESDWQMNFTAVPSCTSGWMIGATNLAAKPWKQCF
jgi:hypothetical protein